jgi:3-isopropylmalate dehydrogenase
VTAVLERGLRTGDIMQEGATRVTTSEMGRAVVDTLDADR